MNVSTMGLLGELHALAGINRTDSDLYLKYISDFPLKNGSTFYQVDIAIVCKAGIFCLEVKNWNCYVLSTGTRYWNIHYPSKDIKVLSPVLQNNMHCKLLRQLLGRDVVNIVLIAGSTLFSERPEGIYSLPEFMHYLSQRPKILTELQIDKILDDMLAYKKSQEADMLTDFILKQVRGKLCV